MGGSTVIKLGDPPEVLGRLNKTEESVLQTTIKFN